jgi:hypothetical protein
MDNLPKNLKKINCYPNYDYSTGTNIKKLIPIKNINFSEWNVKYTLFDGHYLQKKSIDDNNTFSPTAYDDKCDFFCECVGNYNPQWGYKKCRALALDFHCRGCNCYDTNCYVCY